MPAIDAAESADSDAGEVDHLLADGFENGLGFPWTGKMFEYGDSVVQSSMQAHAGAFSARCETDDRGDSQASMYVDLDPQSDLYIRAFVMLDTSGERSGYVSLLSTVNRVGDWSNLLSVGIEQDGTVYAWNHSAGEYFPTDTALTPDRWYRLDMRARTSPGGRITVAVDGDVIIDAPTASELQTTSVLLGIVWQEEPGDGQELFLDDVIIDDQPIH